MAKILSGIFIAGLFAVVCPAQAGSVHNQARVKIDRTQLAQLAQTEKNVPSAAGKPSPVNPTATVMFSGTTVGGDTYNRAIESCAGLSGLGTDVNYSVQEFTVDTSGAYDLTSVQGYDGFIFLYTDSFNATDALANCTAANDDGLNGTGFSEIFGVNLTAGTPYFLVTTSFFNGDAGTFENTISGPGGIQLPHLINVTKSTPGVVTGDDFTYDIEVKNLGSSDEQVTVTDVLPAGLSYVSDDCGGSFAGGTWTWSGNVLSGASPTCTLTVHNSSQECTIITNTATATTPAPSNLVASSTTTNADPTAPPADQSIEDSGVNNGGDWQSTSTNFGTVFCSQGFCTNSPDLTAADGSWWAWFAGTDPTNPGFTFPEVGTLSQDFVIPTGVTDLHFMFRAPNCSGLVDDFLAVRVDGTEVYRVDASSPLCGSTDYSDEVADVSAFADGNVHTVEFYSEQTNLGTDVTNFFVDSINFNIGICQVGNDVIFADGFEVLVP